MLMSMEFGRKREIAQLISKLLALHLPAMFSGGSIGQDCQRCEENGQCEITPGKPPKCLCSADKTGEYCGEFHVFSSLHGSGVSFSFRINSFRSQLQNAHQ